MREKSKKLLPKWGPYSKKYMGISRVMEESRIPGARYDLVIHPTYANSAFPVPNVTFPAGFHQTVSDEFFDSLSRFRDPVDIAALCDSAGGRRAVPRRGALAEISDSFRRCRAGQAPEGRFCSDV